MFETRVDLSNDMTWRQMIGVGVRRVVLARGECRQWLHMSDVAHRAVSCFDLSVSQWGGRRAPSRLGRGSGRAGVLFEKQRTENKKEGRGPWEKKPRDQQLLRRHCA